MIPSFGTLNSFVESVTLFSLNVPPSKSSPSIILVEGVLDGFDLDCWRGWYVPLCPATPRLTFASVLLDADIFEQLRALHIFAAMW